MLFFVPSDLEGRVGRVAVHSSPPGSEVGRSE